MDKRISGKMAYLATGLMLTICALPQLALAEGELEHCITAPEGVNVVFREKPSTKSEEIGLGSNGACGLWIKPPCRNGWCLVQTHEFDGWVQEKYLRRKSG